MNREFLQHWNANNFPYLIVPDGDNVILKKYQLDNLEGDVDLKDTKIETIGTYLLCQVADVIKQYNIPGQPLESTDILDEVIQSPLEDWNDNHKGRGLITVSQEPDSPIYIFKLFISEQLIFTYYSESKDDYSVLAKLFSYIENFNLDAIADMFKDLYGMDIVIDKVKYNNSTRLKWRDKFYTNLSNLVADIDQSSLDIWKEVVTKSSLDTWNDKHKGKAQITVNPDKMCLFMSEPPTLICTCHVDDYTYLMNLYDCIVDDDLTGVLKILGEIFKTGFLIEKSLMYGEYRYGNKYYKQLSSVVKAVSDDMEQGNFLTGTVLSSDNSISISYNSIPVSYSTKDSPEIAHIKSLLMVNSNPDEILALAKAIQILQ